MKFAHRDGNWAVVVESALVLNVHSNQQHPLAPSLEICWTFRISNHPFCPCQDRSGISTRVFEIAVHLNCCSQSWFPHWCLCWDGQQEGPWASVGILRCSLSASRLTPRPFLGVPPVPSLQNGDSDASTAFAKSFARLVSLLQMLHEI